MPQSDTKPIPKWTWTQLTDADVTAITFQNVGGAVMLVEATNGGTAPTSTAGALEYRPGQGENNITVATLFAGVPSVTDDDWLLVYDNAGGSTPSGKATRAAVLLGVARNGAAMTPASVASTGAVTAPSGSIDALTVATSLTIGATLQKVRTVSGTLNIPTIASNAEGSATITLTGCVVGDQAILQLPSTFPAGLLLSRAVVTGADTVTAYFYNATGSSITGAGYTVRATALRFA